MHTTDDLPESLVQEPMAGSRMETKTELAKTARQDMIQREKLGKIKTYFGAIDLDIDLDASRKRWQNSASSHLA